MELQEKEEDKDKKDTGKPITKNLKNLKITGAY